MFKSTFRFSCFTIEAMSKYFYFLPFIQWCFPGVLIMLILIDQLITKAVTVGPSKIN